MAAYINTSETEVTVKDITVYTKFLKTFFSWTGYMVKCYSNVTLGDRLTRWWYCLPLLPWKHIGVLDLLYDGGLLLIYVLSWDLAYDDELWFQIVIWFYAVSSNLVLLLLCFYVLPLLYWTHRLSLVARFPPGVAGMFSNHFIEISTQQLYTVGLATDESLLAAWCHQKATVTIMLYSGYWGQYHLMFMIFTMFRGAATGVLYAVYFGLEEILGWILLFGLPQLGLYLSMLLFRHMSVYRALLLWFSRF